MERLMEEEGAGEAESGCDEGSAEREEGGLEEAGGHGSDISRLSML